MKVVVINEKEERTIACAASGSGNHALEALIASKNI